MRDSDYAPTTDDMPPIQFLDGDEPLPAIPTSPKPPPPPLITPPPARLTPPPLARPQQYASPRGAASPSRRRTGLVTMLLWAGIVLITLGVLRFAVPYIAEEIQYALTRGQLRAEYEVAGEGLKSDPLQALTVAYNEVSKRAGPSVVHINTSSGETRGQGSGVIVDAEGYIVTNQHVISDSRSIEVHLSDGRTVPAIVIGEDKETDIAVLRIEAGDLMPAEWGDSDKLQVGSPVWAVGSPFGLERTITLGILSAKNRAGKAGTVYQDFLQTDAAVNPGNSGGPLVDAQGRVVGINTAIVGQTYQGISFAVPSNVAKSVYDRLRSEGRVIRGWLGVALGEVDERTARRAGLDEPRGVYVLSVVDEPGISSPALTAGIRKGDVILKFNGVALDRPQDLSRAVADTPAGSTVDVILFRDGDEKTVQVLIGERN